MKKLLLPFTFFLLLAFNQSMLSQTITIAEAIEDLDMNFIPDRLDDTVTVEGVVISPNYQTTNSSFYIYDWTAGTDIFFSGTVFSWELGDSVRVTGTVDHFNGVSEIIPLTSTSWDSISSGNPLPDPIVITIDEYETNGELYEGSLIGLIGLTRVGGTWPVTPISGSGVTLQVSDGVDTVDLRIDTDTDIDGQPEPAWPMDIIAVGGQFDNSAPNNSGYQLMPRYYATDFLPSGSIPVELTSFSAASQNNGILLKWTTATELNNSGFDIERKQENANWTKVSFVEGNGTTSLQHEYSFFDGNLSSGKYLYRLRQIDYDGSYKYSDIVEADVHTISKFELSQNYPNPFNPSTKISYSIPQTGFVSLKVYNALGQEVSTLVNGVKEAGSYNIIFNASNLNSGIYFYQFEAGNLSEVKKMTLIK